MRCSDAFGYIGVLSPGLLPLTAAHLPHVRAVAASDRSSYPRTGPGRTREMSLSGSKAPASDRATLRVLLIEDSIDDADLVADELRAGGYVLEYERVDTVAALRAALRTRSWQL